MESSKKAEKNILREQARVLRSSLAKNKETHDACCKKAQENLLSSLLWEQCKNICIYYAVKGEVDTSLIAQSAWAAKKKVLFPLCEPQEFGKMKFSQCHSLNDLQDGLFKIPEPVHACRTVSAQEIQQDPHAIILVPALAYDRNGYRLGYGGGYYDRYLNSVPEIISIGLAFEEHLFSELPRDPWDKAVKYLCTNKALTKTNKG